jgi:hypothetical protein
MQRSWTIESASTLSLPNSAYDLTDQGRKEFFAEVETFPDLLRNEATRMEEVRPPAAVADLQARLEEELRAYAGDVDRTLKLFTGDRMLELFKNDERDYSSKQRALERLLDRDARAIGATVDAFHKQGYVIALKPED